MFSNIVGNLKSMFQNDGTNPLEYILEVLDSYSISEIEKIASILEVAEEESAHGAAKVLRRVIGVYQLNDRWTDDEKQEKAKEAIAEISKVLTDAFKGSGSGEPPVEPLPKDGPNDPPPFQLPTVIDGLSSLRSGIWVTNGHPGDTLETMWGLNPTSMTCIYDHLGPNRIHGYKALHPECDIIIRFMHPQNWRDDVKVSAENWAREIASKWDNIEELDPYIICANEVNLGPESGSDIPAFENIEFYELFGLWFNRFAEIVKNEVPEMKLICPPFAIGHNEDGVPENGIPKIGWSGYQFLHKAIDKYCDNIIGFHGYWGDLRGPDYDRLYHPEESTWYAFRWKRVRELFKSQWNQDVKFIIDECGQFDASHPDFTRDLMYYLTYTLSDPDVLAVTPFLWFDPTENPGSIGNSWVHKIPPDRMDHHISQLRDNPFSWMRDAIKLFESEGNYEAKNPKSSASGAYQYIDDTWNNYQGYSRAYLAPKETQDERMMNDLRSRFKLYRGNIRKIIGAHYLPAWVNNESMWDNNKYGLTLRQYVNGVMEEYWRI